jgi:ketosteroid isomerase-like protein
MKLSNSAKIIQVKKQIEDIYAKICSSFAEMDLDSVLSYFSDREDMVKISNGTILRGKKELSEYWHKRLGVVDNLQISIENVEVHIIDSNNVWATADEHIVLGEHSQKAIVTNIFILEATGWKILLDHTTYIQ